MVVLIEYFNIHVKYQIVMIQSLSESFKLLLLFKKYPYIVLCIVHFDNMLKFHDEKFQPVCVDDQSIF